MLPGCDEEGLVFRVLEALAQVLIVAKAAGGNQQELQDQDSWSGERKGGCLSGAQLGTPPYPG